MLQSTKGNSYDVGTGVMSSTLMEEQRLGRELFLFAEKHEKKSQASQIYANVGLACLGIRRLLQACYPFLDYPLIIMHVLGSIR